MRVCAKSLRSPLPRAAVETFLDVSPDPGADVGRSREGAGVDDPADHLEGGSSTPTTPARALDAGVEGVWVLSTRRTADRPRRCRRSPCCPKIVDRVAGRVPVIFDSGIPGRDRMPSSRSRSAPPPSRLGRPYAYGLAVAGEAGVREVVRNILAELDITLGLSLATVRSPMSPATPSAPPSLRGSVRTSATASFAAIGR